MDKTLYSLLDFLDERPDGVLIEQIPAKLCTNWLEYAFQHGYARRCMFSHAIDYAHPRGYIAAQITPDGHCALAKEKRRQHIMRKKRDKERAEEETRIQERIEDRRHDWAIAIFGFLSGSAFTLIVEHVLIPFVFHG